MNTEQIDGTVTAVFAHRFVVEGPQGKTLVDVGPEAGRSLAVAEGDRIAVSGERKPSELKATSVTLADGSTHTIGQDKPDEKKPHDDRPDDPEAALAAVRDAGYTVEGEAKRKPKHFEIIGRKGDDRFELHVELDGKVRKTTPLATA